MWRLPERLRGHQRLRGVPQRVDAHVLPDGRDGYWPPPEVRLGSSSYSPLQIEQNDDGGAGVDVKNATARVRKIWCFCASRTRLFLPSMVSKMSYMYESRYKTEFWRGDQPRAVERCDRPTNCSHTYILARRPASCLFRLSFVLAPQ